VFVLCAGCKIDRQRGMAVGAYWLNEDRASNRVGECLADARRHNGNARSIPTCDEKNSFRHPSNYWTAASGAKRSVATYTDQTRRRRTPSKN